VRFKYAPRDTRARFITKAQERPRPVDAGEQEWRCGPYGDYFHRDDLLITDDLDPQCPACFERETDTVGWDNVYPRRQPPPAEASELK
jgi:hypothetical protein